MASAQRRIVRRTSREEAAARSKTGAAALSVVSNSVLILLKFIVGLMSGSVSLLSEAAHSASDLVAAVIALFSVRAAARPADPRHHYGHEKVENVSGIIEALLIFGAAVVIVYEGISKLIHGGHIEHMWLAIGVMGTSAIANLVVSEGVLYPTARRTESAALEADAAHLRTDVLTSLGVVIGLLLVKFTGVTWLDPIAAIAIALVILHTAYRLIVSSGRVLLDEALPEVEMEAIRCCLREHRGDLIVGYHKLRARRAGSRRHIDLHVTVEERFTVSEAHDVAEHIATDIRQCLPNVDVLVHIEPDSHDREDGS